MKILLVNKYFYLRGGSDKVFFDEAALLQSKGHKVGFFSMQHPRNFPSRYAPDFVSRVDYAEKMGLLRRWQAAGRILYSLEAKRKLRRLLARERFDIVHLHNIYHQLSPSILDAVAEAGLPAVMTLHDYKMVCPAYTLFSRGRVCERCSQGRYFHVLLRRCVQDSYGKSLVCLAEMYLHHRLLGLYGKVARFIAPSQFMKNKLQDLGFPGQVSHVPNFVNAEAYLPHFGGEEQSLVYFGRLSKEKGLPTLLQAMAGLPATLKLIGEGPERPRLAETVRQARLANVRFLGYRQGASLWAEIRRSRFTVLPSEWYENFPLAVLESFALGKPVLGARIGGIPELVQDGETGLTFEPGNVKDLREKILYLLNHPHLLMEMGRKGRELAEKEFNPQKHYESLMSIFRFVSNFG